MSELKFPCPHCGQSLSCEAGYGGFQITCPVCVRDLVVPKRSSADSAGAPSAAPPPPGIPPRLYPKTEDLDFWTEEEWNHNAAALERRAPKRKSTLRQLYDGAAGWFWYLFLGPPFLLLAGGMVSSLNPPRIVQTFMGWLVLLGFIVGVVGSGFALARTQCRTKAGKIICGLAYCVLFGITLPIIWAFAGCAIAAGGFLILNPIFSIFGR